MAHTAVKTGVDMRAGSLGCLDHTVPGARAHADLKGLRPGFKGGKGRGGIGRPATAPLTGV
ncbi:hypothetical protein ROR02_24100 [Pararhodospirillum oryzae]|uniref:Uncharacterized protein n=1 Tax=Pararhodospirillum oryzae TaxID=478448 RepID=A0A512HA09_9PROT|nr:hypothetical protein ROR02_24100 [Pararhodospirillum oryzae]